MRGRHGIAARTFSAISAAGVNVVAIAQGLSELNITVAVPEATRRARSRRCTASISSTSVRPLADTTGRASKLTLLGFGRSAAPSPRSSCAQQKHLRRRSASRSRSLAIADRSGVRVEEHGFDAAELQRLARKPPAVVCSRADSPLTLAQLPADAA
jgi:hypothetical protein